MSMWRMTTACTWQKWLSWPVIIHLPARCGLPLMLMFLFWRQDSEVHHQAYQSHFLKPKRNHDRGVCILNFEICFVPAVVFVLLRVQDGATCFNQLSFFFFSRHSRSSYLRENNCSLKWKFFYVVDCVIKVEFKVVFEVTLIFFWLGI
jgi:hypothetical protein